MQNRGALWIFTILLALACLWQLSFSFFTSRMEKRARVEAGYSVDSLIQAEPAMAELDRDSLEIIYENRYLRTHGDEKVYPVFGYSYAECKEREMNMGLDLKGGMAVTLEVSVPELVENLSGNSTDPSFLAAMDAALVAYDGYKGNKTRTADSKERQAYSTPPPLAAIGAIALLAAAGESISVTAIIGLIVLAGVVVNNGIVMVDFVNQLKATGMKTPEAVRKASLARLRPILMTALTTILGLVPLAIGRGAGSELERPLALTVIGGLTTATFLTLFVIPIIYELMDEAGHRLSHRGVH